MRRRRFVAWGGCALGAAAGVAAGAPGTVLVYPRAEHPGDRRDDYPAELLALALRKVGRPYTLQPSAVFMLQGRAITELERAGTLDVIWTMTSAERERTLLPVRIPIDRGMIGWRLLLVREQALPRFAALPSADALKRLRGGQGFDWPDIAILRAAGFEIESSVRYDELFDKLAGQRIDHFPRSVMEIWEELDTHPGRGLAVEPTWALHYPTAMYFFVNRRRPELAEEIRQGLELALADGSFEALFKRRFGAELARAGLERRRIVELPNPLLPPETPVADRRLWHRPGR